MTQRTISLNEKAYTMLKKAKQEAESYSEAIIRLVKETEESSRGDILLKLAGSFKENADEWKRIESEITDSRGRHLTSEDA
jgi:predicted CopG family antitoxin